MENYIITIDKTKKFCLVSGEECNNDWLIRKFGFAGEVREREGIITIRDCDDSGKYQQKLTVYTDLSIQEAFSKEISQLSAVSLIHGVTGKEKEETLKLPAKERWYIKPYNQVNQDYPKWKESQEFWKLL